jgi:hypothetical protein
MCTKTIPSHHFPLLVTNSVPCNPSRVSAKALRSHLVPSQHRDTWKRIIGESLGGRPRMPPHHPRLFDVATAHRRYTNRLQHVVCIQPVFVIVLVVSSFRAMALRALLIVSSLSLILSQTHKYRYVVSIWLVGDYLRKAFCDFAA